MEGDDEMNYYLNDYLTGINEAYFIKNDFHIRLEQFCCEPNFEGFYNPTILETSLSFLTKLELFPIYIHEITFGLPANLSSTLKDTKEINTNFFYTIKKIQDSRQLKEVYSKVTLDAYNGETIVITSEKTLNLVEPKENNDLFKYELNFGLTNRKTYFLIIQLDGQCWDFISNFKNHPFQEFHIEV